MDIEVVKVNNQEELEVCCVLRKEVFGKEEQGPKELYIIDNYDKKDTTRNYLLKVNKVFVATVRFIEIDNETIKLQRLVVLNQYRKKGYAKIILKFLEDDARYLGYKKIVMDSAFKAVGFYEKYGYIKTSKLFYEDNRPHVKMEKNLI